MSLLRFLGLGATGAGRDAEPESLILLGRQAEALPPESARLTAAFAYLLARVAGADLRTEGVEKQAMAERLAQFAQVDLETARALAEAAVQASDLHSATDDHLVARAFSDMADTAERHRLLRCLYAVAAADETITTMEDNEIFEIASAIGVGRSEVIAIRSEWRDALGTLRALPKER